MYCIVVCNMAATKTERKNETSVKLSGLLCYKCVIMSVDVWYKVSTFTFTFTFIFFLSEKFSIL